MPGIALEQSLSDGSGTVAPKQDGGVRTCANCRSMLWLVALGQGIRCLRLENRTPDGKDFAIPSRQHTCALFEEKAA